MPPENDDAVAEGVAAEPAAPSLAETGAEQHQDVATTSAEPTSLLDAAMSALKATETATAAPDVAATADDTTVQTASADAVEASGDAADPHYIPAEEFKALPKSAKAAVIALRKEVKGLQTAASKAAAIDEYMRSTGVSPEEFADGQEVMALMKRGDAKALERLEGYVAKMRSHLGLELGDDLKQDVDQGYMSEERARELSQARARAANAERTEASIARDVAVKAMVSTVESWEATTKAVDPDFARKLPLVQEKVRLAALELGRSPSGPDEALAMVKAAYTATNETLRSFAPAPAATRPTPTSAASAPARPVAPKSLHEAALRSLGMA